MNPLPEDLSADLSAPLPTPPPAPTPATLPVPRPGPSPVQDLSAKLLEIANQVASLTPLEAPASRHDLDEMRAELQSLKEAVMLPIPGLTAKIDDSAAATKRELEELRKELQAVKEAVALPPPGLTSKLDEMAAATKLELEEMRKELLAVKETVALPIPGLAKLEEISATVATLAAVDPAGAATRADLEVLYKAVEEQIATIKPSEPLVTKAELTEQLLALKPTEASVTKADLDELLKEIQGIKKYQEATFQWIQAIGERVGLKSEKSGDT